MHKIHVSLALRMENSNLNGTSYKPMFMEFLKGIPFFFFFEIGIQFLIRRYIILKHPTIIIIV